jgi:protocatechuate 3,4-dioxygenase beta subunit
MKNLLHLFCITCFISFFQTIQAQDSANVLEEIPFDYMTRSPIYDYSEKNLNNTDTIPGFETQENKLKITGTIFQSDGVTPAKDVILYINQPDANGEYDLKYENDKRYVYNRGWIKTDANGQYTFYTFIPGSYPHSKELRKINPIVKESGKPEYALYTWIFADDPFLTKACKKRLNKKGINNILTTLKKDDIYVSNYNIVLPETVPETK